MSKPDLKPCPFCGSEVEIGLTSGVSMELIILCSGCKGVFIPREGEFYPFADRCEDGAIIWNTRAEGASDTAAALDSIASAQLSLDAANTNHSHWIPVSERMPRVGYSVLVYPPLCERNATDSLGSDHEWFFYRKDNPYSPEEAPYTHWMAIPEPREMKRLTLPPIPTEAIDSYRKQGGDV